MGGRGVSCHLASRERMKSWLRRGPAEVARTRLEAQRLQGGSLGPNLGQPFGKD